MTRAEQLIARLYTARKERDEARNILARTRSILARTVFTDDCSCNPEEYVFLDACHDRWFNREMYFLCRECPIRPLYLDYIAKGNKAGAALRALLREGKRLSGAEAEAEAEMVERYKRENAAMEKDRQADGRTSEAWP